MRQNGTAVCLDVLVYHKAPLQASQFVGSPGLNKLLDASDGKPFIEYNT